MKAARVEEKGSFSDAIRGKERRKCPPK